jgi:hypothetical protein
MRNQDDGGSVSLRHSRFVYLVLHLLLAGAVSHALLNYRSHASDYILEQFGFRQTQTAITTYWFLRDGFHFAYLTPVLGAPWSVPFEFPLFQLLTAYVVKVAGLSVDTAGRTVSFVFFLATLWPMFLIGRWMKLPRSFFPIAAILYCCSPLYLFWGKTFMIESLALFLALLFLSLALRVLSANQTPRHGLFVALCVTGTLAVLVKVTTAGATFLLVFVLLAASLVRKRRPGQRLNVGILTSGPELPTLVALLLAGACFMVWDRFADAIKATSELTAWLESANLTAWNFGTASDRIGSELWLSTVFGRAVSESIGAGAMLVLGVAIARRLTQQQWFAVVVFLALFFGPFLIFPRLHIIHSYYQYANAVYLLLSAAVVLAALSEERPVWAVGLVLVIATLQLKGFAEGYRTVQGAVRNPGDSRSLELSLALRNHVARDAAFLGFGLDWSSEVPYYSERRGVLVHGSNMLETRLAANPAHFLGGVPLEAVVICPGVYQSREFVTAISLLTEGSRKEVVAGCEVFSEIRGPGSAQLSPTR